MASLGCIERVSNLLSSAFNDNDNESEISKVYSELLQYLNQIDFVSDATLNKFFDEGKISRCFEVGWARREKFLKAINIAFKKSEKG